ncbi:TraR/DksA family transcriptional regulator [Enemella evansiae]|uniref:DNA-binding protein n=1 Tax=Enemella evansiae TaxID=2016499 RepID=A0A255GFS0_9ACTN|nr:TraR/DksA family transcriptional regulator [Enemella evansiae]OYO08565.1 DNA-binding protein [Enemella evansiae]OYO13198.1 DNA-binding protein [Enemella evansiae]OYO14689.1 DNA-binding protein [Enemella evansiae]TDO93748.1 TraR/DksA family transcriptional regulator [Enemella evansiae]
MPTAKKAEKASAAKKPAAKKAPAKATSPAKKSSAAKKTTAKKAPASKAAPAKQASATKQATPAKQTATKKAPAKQPTSDEKPATKKAPAKQAPAKQAAADTAPRGLDPNRKPASKPSEFPVRQGEDKWTRAELDEVRNDLEAEVVKHRRSIELAEAELQELLADGADGAGRDAADVGSANFERDQEMSLAAAAREMLTQTEHALRLIDQGLYGWCESCGEPIGKGRLQVYPRATMCVVCKQRHERR